MRPQSSPGATAARGDGSSRRPDSVPAFAAELGLLALALGTAASFLRLFDTWSFVSEFAIALVTPWLLALTLRRLRVGLAAALGLGTAFGLAAGAGFASATGAGTSTL